VATLAKKRSAEHIEQLADEAREDAHARRRARGASTEHQEPPTVSQEAPTEARGYQRYLPAHEPLPAEYVRPRVLACLHCRRMRLDDGVSQAVIVRAISPDGTVASLHCKGCLKSFKLPVRGERRR
jgi:hypothetical protein